MTKPSKETNKNCQHKFGEEITCYGTPPIYEEKEKGKQLNYVRVYKRQVCSICGKSLIKK